uniref:Uncharacterized protein n=1 Tax=Pygocentrus nattereri TaxID=42514 RepID=A0A3B4D1Z3_PYGNA
VQFYWTFLQAASRGRMSALAKRPTHYTGPPIGRKIRYKTAETPKRFIMDFIIQLGVNQTGGFAVTGLFSPRCCWSLWFCCPAPPPSGHPRKRSQVCPAFRPMTAGVGSSSPPRPRRRSGLDDVCVCVCLFEESSVREI